ncbi:MAG: hypothetical protein QM765_29695 [Myxococcales bacterium]
MDKGHSKTVRVELPACERCESWFKKSRVLVWTFAVGMLGGILLAILASIAVEDRWPYGVWLLVAVGWLVTHLARRRQFRKLRLSEFSDDRYVYFVSDERYARALAELNGLDCRERTALNVAD